MTVRKEARRGAVILFASMFFAGNRFSSAGGTARSRLFDAVVERYEAAHQNEITTGEPKSLAVAVKIDGNDCRFPRV
jgi:hypothetical protein